MSEGNGTGRCSPESGSSELSSEFLSSTPSDPFFYYFPLGWKEMLHLHKKRQRGRASEFISEKNTDFQR